VPLHRGDANLKKKNLHLFIQPTHRRHYLRGCGVVWKADGHRLVSCPEAKKYSSSDPQKNGIARCRVVHACNPSYSGGRDQENRGSKPAGK
jgi:hypothetical protein